MKTPEQIEWELKRPFSKGELAMVPTREFETLQRRRLNDVFGRNWAGTETPDGYKLFYFVGNRIRVVEELTLYYAAKKLGITTHVYTPEGIKMTPEEYDEKHPRPEDPKEPDIKRYNIVIEKGSDIFSAYTVVEDNADGSWVKYEDHTAALKSAKWWEHKRELTAEQVLDEELMVCGLGELDSFKSPFDALQAILDFHLDMLDFSRGEQ